MIARTGRWALYSALKQCCPSSIRSDDPFIGRHGLTEIEFNKVLERNGFVKIRDRSGASPSIVERRQEKQDEDGKGCKGGCQGPPRLCCAIWCLLRAALAGTCACVHIVWTAPYAARVPECACVQTNEWCAMVTGGVHVPQRCSTSSQTGAGGILTTPRTWNSCGPHGNSLQIRPPSLRDSVSLSACAT